jgi:FixJ family two-component response regulator
LKAPPPTLHIIDDDASFRRSVGRLLEAKGYRVEFYASGAAFLAAPLQPGPGCILLDLQMPGENGLVVQARLAKAAPLLPVIFLSGHGDIQRTVLAIKGGAEDFLEKTGPTEMLLAAIGRALDRYQDRLADQDKTGELRRLVDSLTPREAAVFKLIIRGRRNKEVAFVLGTSERTIKAHRKSIMNKLQVGSLAEAVSVAERLGSLTPDGSADVKTTPPVSGAGGPAQA